MGYEIFSQSKVELTSQKNSISLQQTQRSNEQNILATDTLSLQQQLSSLQAAQSQELSEFYEMLSHLKESTDSNGNRTGTFDKDYLDSFSDTYESHGEGQQTERGRDINDYSADAREYLDPALGNSSGGTDLSRESINAKIKEKQSEFDAELSDINNEIYKDSVKENALEMEVKRLDTALTAVDKRLEAMEQAEPDAIDKATPQFNGLG